MLIREYTPADLDALRALHAAQGFDYAFPDLADPLFVSKLVLEEGPGAQTLACPESRRGSVPSQTAQAKAYATAPQIRAAALLRLTCEAYLLLDRRDEIGRASCRERV